jgi:hypothetical protein
VARFGSFVLTSEDEFAAPYEEMLLAIADALSADSRVRNVRRAKIDDNDCYSAGVFPPSSKSEVLLKGSDYRKYLRFSLPLLFSVEVPEKNQPKRRRQDVIPTSYEVVWDGVLLMVAWEADELPDASGGHVVGEILAQAAEKVGRSLLIQGCNPNCEHQFAHADIRIVEAPGELEAPEYRRASERIVVDAAVPGEAKEEVLLNLFADIQLAAEEFMFMKNRGRRILALEVECRLMLSQLMAISYVRSELATKGLLDRIRGYWTGRTWRQNSRQRISSIWLAMASIEQLRREWEEVRRHFERAANHRGMDKLFETDHAGESEDVDKLDLAPVSAAVQEAAERMDNRALLVVTGVAAVAGAIGGAVAGVAAG